MGPFPTAGTGRIPILGGVDGWDLCVFGVRFRAWGLVSGL